MLLNKLTIVTMLIFLSNSSAFAENFKNGTYTSFEYHEESGDIVGIEISIIPSRTEYWVVFQESQGEPRAPIIVPAKIYNDTITFELPDSSNYSGRFVGKFLKGYIVGEFESSVLAPDGSKFFRLRYGSSYWQATP